MNDEEEQEARSPQIAGGKREHAIIIATQSTNVVGNQGADAVWSSNNTTSVGHPKTLSRRGTNSVPSMRSSEHNITSHDSFYTCKDDTACIESSVVRYETVLAAAQVKQTEMLVVTEDSKEYEKSFNNLSMRKRSIGEIERPRQASQKIGETNQVEAEEQLNYYKGVFFSPEEEEKGSSNLISTPVIRGRQQSQRQITPRLLKQNSGESSMSQHLIYDRSLLQRQKSDDPQNENMTVPRSTQSQKISAEERSHISSRSSTQVGVSFWPTTLFSKFVAKLGGGVSLLRSQVPTYANATNQGGGASLGKSQRLISTRSNKLSVRRDLRSASESEDPDLLYQGSDDVPRQTEYTEKSVTASRVDFEELIEHQRESEMPTHVMWITVEQKHLNRIAKMWTWVCILIQGNVFALIICTYCFIGLLKFKDDSKLTPLFYRDPNSGFWFYGTFFFKPSICEEAIIEGPHYDCICDDIQGARVFFLNTFLNFVLLAGLCSNLFGIYAKFQILKGYYFRFTNLILINQSMQFICAPLVWYLIAGDLNSECGSFGWFVILLPSMGLALLICYIWGRYYAAKLDYANAVQNLLQDSDEGSGSTEEASEFDSKSDGFFHQVLREEARSEQNNGLDSSNRLISQALSSQQALTSRQGLSSQGLNSQGVRSHEGTSVESSGQLRHSVNNPNESVGQNDDNSL